MDGKPILVADQPEKPGYVIVIVLAFILNLAMIAINGLQMFDTGLFKRDIGDTSDLFTLDVTPAGWTFTIWAFIFTGLVIMTIYALTLTCRRNALTGGKLYNDPPFLPPTFFGVYMLALILVVTWLFTFDSEFIVASLIALIGVTLSLYICIALAIRLMWKYEESLSRTELWLNVILVQNTLGLFATWVTVATSLNVGIVLRYQVEYSMSTSCWVVLGIILGMFLLYVLIDFVFLSVKLRYFFTPYIVLIVASAGIVQGNYDLNDVDYIRFAIGILGGSIFLSVIKILLTVIRAVRNPSPLERDS